jgi:hypothetical protein
LAGAELRLSPVGPSFGGCSRAGTRHSARDRDGAYGTAAQWHWSSVGEPRRVSCQIVTRVMFETTFKRIRVWLHSSGDLEPLRARRLKTFEVRQVAISMFTTEASSSRGRRPRLGFANLNPSAGDVTWPVARTRSARGSGCQPECQLEPPTASEVGSAPSLQVPGCARLGGSDAASPRTP